MTVVDARHHPYDLPLRRPWITSRGRLERRRGWTVAVRACDGVRGYGDCAPLPLAGTEDAETAEASLRRVLADVCCLPAAVGLCRVVRATPAARAAIETALLDALARAEGRPLARHLDRGAAGAVRVNAALGALDDDAAARAADAVAAGYTVLKVKVGGRSAEAEADAVAALAATLPDGVALRLDANGAWDPQAAHRFLRGLEGLPVESLEEPVREPDIATLAHLQDAAPCPLAVDESLMRLGVEAVIDAAPVARIVLKPSVLGGPRRTLEAGRAARAAGLQAVVTTVLDSAAGVWAAAHLAAALDPGETLHHGLATGEWLAADTGPGPEVTNGRLVVGEAPGLGFTPAR